MLRKLILLGLLVCLHGVIFAQNATQEKNSPMAWVGGVKISDDWIYMNFILGKENASSAILHIPQKGIVNQKIEKVEIKENQINFILPHGNGKITFDGKISNDKIAGNLNLRNIESKFILTRYNYFDPKMLSQFAGLYEFEKGHFSHFTINGDSLKQLDLKSGKEKSFWAKNSSTTQFFEVLPLSDKSFTSQIPAQISFDKDEIIYQDGTGKTQKGKKSKPYKEEQVEFYNGKVKLVGSLKTPLTKGLHPVVVIVSGSGPYDRNGYEDIQLLLITQGFAVFSYDKRGVGASKVESELENYNNVGFDLLAKDVAAGVSFLKARSDINSSQIGLWGHSQGGWIAPLVAIESKDIAFLILVSAPTINPISQITYVNQAYLKALKFSDAEIAEAVGYMNKVSAVLVANGEGWESLVSDIENSRKQDWGDFVVAPPSKESFLRNRPILLYEPIPALMQLKIPVLALFGENDKIVPAVQSAVTMNGIFTASGLKDFQIKRFSDGNHEIKQSVSGTEVEWASQPGYSEGYFETMISWLNQKLKKT